MNNSMIDFLKDAFGLTSKTLKQLPNIFFYGMYVFSIPISLLINRIGYKNGVLSGLGVVALGFFLCIPLVAMGYVPFLVGVITSYSIHYTKLYDNQPIRIYPELSYL